MIIYALILLGCFTALIYGLTTRTNIELDIGRDRNILYRELGNGDIENIYSLKILNKDRKDHRYQVLVEGLDQARLVLDDENLMVPTATTTSFHLRVIADPDSIPKSVNTIRFKVIAIDDSSIVVISDARFVGP